MEIIEKLTNTELLLAFIAWLIPVLISVWAVRISRHGAPDYYAAPNRLSYWVTESNTLTKDSKPEKSSLVVKIENRGKTPARDLKIVVRTLTSSPKITSNEKYETLDGPAEWKIVKLERIAPGQTAIVDIVESVSEYPLRFSASPGSANLRYQYSPAVIDVQTEFGPLNCDYERCARLCLPLPEDGGQPTNHLPKELSQDIANELRKKLPGFKPLDE